MTVKELIEQLSQYNEGKEVVVSSILFWSTPTPDVREIKDTTDSDVVFLWIDNSEDGPLS